MTPNSTVTIGIDFGTTNTVVALAGPNGEVEVLRFAAPDGELTAFRSTLGFQLHEEHGRPPERIVEAGPWAIDAYVEDPLETRFIQSFKTFAASSGYALYQAISRLKMDLSDAAAATFEFSAGSIRIQAEVARSDFEDWISPELTAIEIAVDQAIERSGLEACDIDRIFLTGGTSFVPAVRDIFHRRFDPARIETGGEFESVASGLALIGFEADLDLWTERKGPGQAGEI